METFHAQLKEALEVVGIPLLLVLIVLILLDARAHDWEHNERTALIACVAMFILLIVFGKT